MTGQNDDNNDITDNSDNIQNSVQIPRPTVLLMMFYMTVFSIHCPLYHVILFTSTRCNNLYCYLGASGLNMGN